MNSSNSQIVHNRLASQYVCRLLHRRQWDELKLAEVSGVLPSVISAHLSCQRPIRPQHLAAYLRVLDRQERSALLDVWLQDNVDCEAIANLLDGTQTDSMRSLEANRPRMLDWWATAIAGDFKLAKIFHRFRTKAARATVEFPLELLSLASTVAVQFQGWLLEKAFNLFTRVKHAAVALATLVLALCQPDKVTQEAGRLIEQGSELAQKSIAHSLVATWFVAPALAQTTNVDLKHLSPTVDNKKSRVASRARAKSTPRRSQRQVVSAVRIQRTINQQWHRLVRAHRSVHSAVTRLIREARPRQFTQTQRKQRGS